MWEPKEYRTLAKAVMQLSISRVTSRDSAQSSPEKPKLSLLPSLDKGQRKRKRRSEKRQTRSEGKFLQSLFNEVLRLTGAAAENISDLQSLIDSVQLTGHADDDLAQIERLAQALQFKLGTKEIPRFGKDCSAAIDMPGHFSRLVARTYQFLLAERY